MRNKKRLGYAAVLGLAVPFLVFSMVFAEDSVTDPAADAELQKLEETGRTYKERIFEQEKRAMMAREAQKTRLEEARLQGQEVKEGVKERVGERADKLGEVMEKTRDMRVQAMTTVMANMVRRAENVIARMQNVIDRLDSRREKLEGMGADMDDVDAAIAKAQALKEDAQDSLDDAKAKYALIKDNENPKEAAQAFIAAMRELKKDLVATRNALFEVVKAMRASIPQPKERAESDRPEPEGEQGQEEESSN